MAAILQRAARALGIDVPIMRAESAPGGALTLYLYGGRVLHWTPPAAPSPPSAPPPVPPPDDFTAIPGIGTRTANALKKAGYRTFRSLLTASDAALLEVEFVNARTLNAIRAYIRDHIL